MNDGGGSPPMGDGGGEAARMGLRSGMNDVKMEYELQNCTKDHDTCFNLEGTVEGKTLKQKGCGTVKTLVSTILPPLADDLTIQNDECKTISGANNKKLFADVADAKKSKSRLKTLCTCSEDGCNGGNQVEAKVFMPVITAFIISQIFSS